MEDLVIMSGFNYWYQKDCLLRNNIINRDTILYPSKCNILCVLVEFKVFYYIFVIIIVISYFSLFHLFLFFSSLFSLLISIYIGSI